MEFKKENSLVFVPENTDEKLALSRTTHMAIAAHQDDIELMALHGILECFGLRDKHFTAIITADGAGSPRNGLYKDFSDEEMIRVRIEEQKKAAVVGEYSALVMLGYSSKEIKDPTNSDVIDDYVKIFESTRPEIVYTHNLADKHDTHLGVAVKAICAMRKLPENIKPKKVYGCEVWRDLDWVNDARKVVFDTSAHPNIANALISVFDSQICGGKRYDLAAAGRRTANATYGASHSVDKADSLSYAIDLTPLVYDENLDIVEYIACYIREFEYDVRAKLNKLIKN
ncbi:MAG TPA: PIG-L family deacetylase [Clostridia bacterium]|nr:PIG-L family deacetylase [Clostridia bacterium]